MATLRIVGQLGRYAYLRGHYHEVREWMDRAVVADRVRPRGAREGPVGSGRLALLQCDYEPAVRRLDAALRLFRELGRPAGIAAACRCWAVWPVSRAGTPGAVELHAESLAVGRSRR